MSEQYEVAVLDVGPFKVEIRRVAYRDGEGFEFRPIYDPDPTNFGQIQMNAELRYQGGAWAPVPPHLMSEARAAFPRKEGA